MKKKPFWAVLITVCILLLSSCNGHKQLTYLKYEGELVDSLLHSIKPHEARIMPNDILSITVNSTVPGAATDFNLPIIPTGSGSLNPTTVTATASMSGSLQNYMVDKDGYIDYPILGRLKIGGMSVREIEALLKTLICPRYIKTEPIINVRFVNFEIAVLGEVARPGVYKSANGQMTILDALANAGDMTVYGKRDNVLLVRLQENGEFAMHRIDLQDQNLVKNKDLFFMQQNDKLYIEPNKAKGNSSKFGALESLGLSALSILISVIAIITR